MKLYLIEEEWYPVYVIDRPPENDRYAHGQTVEVDATTHERWMKVFADFDAVQNDMAALYKEEALRD